MNNKFLKKLFIVSIVVVGLFVVSNNITQSGASACTITSCSNGRTNCGTACGGGGGGSTPSPTPSPSPSPSPSPTPPTPNPPKPINCNKYDKWLYTGRTQYVDSTECRQMLQKEQVFYDYYKSGKSCIYNADEHRWVNTDTYRNNPNCNGYCGDGMCNNGETQYSCPQDCGQNNCDIYDRTTYTGKTRYVDYTTCKQKLQREKLFRDYYSSGYSCSYNNQYSWEDTGTIRDKPNCGEKNCDTYDQYFYTGKTRYIDYGYCKQMLQREQTFRNYYASGSSCLYVDGTSWKNTSTVITKTGCGVPAPTVYLSNLISDKEADSCSYEVTPTKLYWTVNGTQAYYQLQISNNSSFTDILVDTGKFKSTNQSYTFNPGESALNYWRVRAWNDSGRVSSWVTGSSFNSETYSGYNSECSRSILYYIIPETVKTSKGSRNYEPLPGINVLQSSNDVIRMLFTVENTGDYTNRPVKLKTEIYDDDNPTLLSSTVSDETYIFGDNEKKNFNPVVYNGGQVEGRYLVNISVVDANDTDEKLSNVVHAKYSVGNKMSASLLSVIGDNILWILGAGFLVFLFLVLLSKRKK
jgi:hypothetical protein